MRTAAAPQWAPFKPQNFAVPIHMGSRVLIPVSWRLSSVKQAHAMLVKQSQLLHPLGSLSAGLLWGPFHKTSILPSLPCISLGNSMARKHWNTRICHLHAAVPSDDGRSDTDLSPVAHSFECSWFPSFACRWWRRKMRTWQGRRASRRSQTQRKASKKTDMHKKWKGDFGSADCSVIASDIFTKGVVRLVQGTGTV